MVDLNAEINLGHGTLDRALTQLTRVDGLPVARAAQGLSRLLARVHQGASSPDAWRFSALTSSGFPLEFAFASHGREIRYTCEVTGPESPPRERLPMARDLLMELEGREITGDLLPTWLPGLQRTAHLRYGAWISGRHAADGDRYKLYAEVPDGDAPAVRAYVARWLGQDYLLSDCKSTLRMMGVEPASGCTELYFRIHHLELHHLYPLLAHAGYRQHAATLLDFIQTQRRWPDPHRVPGNVTGVSYAFVPGVAQPICTIFLPAGRLWGTDRAIQQALNRLAAHRGWPMPAYTAVSDGFSHSRPHRHRHGLLALRVDPAGELRIGIGVSPL